MSCTWAGCGNAAAHPQIGDNGLRWADLCDAHHRELNEAIRSAKPMILVSSWVKAQGGSKKAAERLTEDY